ncbi:MAG: serine/threonine protein kinase, partial [Massilia sp.]|nr:serine/threonine protein kinase [Massilia sp.]
MPVGDGASLATASGAATASAPGPRRWLPLALAVAVVLGGVYMLASLLRDGGEDTIMLAHPQPRTRVEAAPAAGAAPPLSSPPPAADIQRPSDRDDSAGSPGPSETLVTAPAKRVKAPAADTLPVGLSIKPWGTVFVDGRERGVSPPLKRLNLPPGTYQVRIVNPGFGEHTVTIEVGKNSANAIAHDFSAAR